MLVLTRKLGESIMIGNGVTVTVVGIDRGKIRLGVQTPRSVPVVRSELLGDDAVVIPDLGPDLSKSLPEGL